MPVTEAQEHALQLASVALDENELAAAVRFTLLINCASRALCQLYGPKDGCHCKDDLRDCHAHMLWDDEARTLIKALDKAGALK